LKHPDGGANIFPGASLVGAVWVGFPREVREVILFGGGVARGVEERRWSLLGFLFPTRSQTLGFL